MEYSKTQRIVILIDLHPLFFLSNNQPYLASIISATKRVLTFPPFSNSLFAIKLFSSSLSPLRSTSRINELLSDSDVNNASLNFDFSSQTMEKLVDGISVINGGLTESREGIKVISGADLDCSDEKKCKLMMQKKKLCEDFVADLVADLGCIDQKKYKSVISGDLEANLISIDEKVGKLMMHKELCKSVSVISGELVADLGCSDEKDWNLMMQKELCEGNSAISGDFEGDLGCSDEKKCELMMQKKKWCEDMSVISGELIGDLASIDEKVGRLLLQKELCEGNSIISGDLRPSVENVCSALLRIVHDYGWESDIEVREDELLRVRENLVVLFSPIGKSLNELGGFMNLKSGNDCLESCDRFVMEFRRVFSSIKEAFDSRDIHFSWVDVNYELGGNGMNDKEFSELGYIEKGIRSLNWGCCVSDEIVLGSVLVPFHLIYPKIGVCLNSLDSLEKSSAQLSLEIEDVNGKPLICKCCDLELLDLRAFRNVRSVGIIDVLESKDLCEEKGESRGRFFGCYGNGMKLQVTAVFSSDEGNVSERMGSENFLVRGFSGGSRKGKCKSPEEFIADKVLKVLSNEPGENSWSNCEPIWQILLSFLQSRGYWATVSITNDKGDVVFATLKPFTIHWGLLSITTGNVVQDRDCGGVDKTGRATNDFSASLNLDVIGSQTDTSTSGKKEPSDGKRRKSNKHPNQDLTWSSLRSAELECTHLDLAEVYFSKHLNRSKKLKFLKCWMKQIWKCSQAKFSGVQAVESQEQSENHNFPEHSQVADEVLSAPSCKTSESFFSDLVCRIQHAIWSKMDLQSFAQRLVKSSIYWLCQTTETDENVTERKPKVDPSCKEMVYKELRRLLLKNPKDMKQMRAHTDCLSDNLKDNSVTKNIVREYELQIFLRMEILQSEVAISIKESTKHKLLKQICSLLEILQYLLEGGIHGPIKLFDYIERNIKFRYFDVLEDAVNEIYTRMDLLPFGDDDEAQIQLLDSEDSNHSWRDRQEGYEKAEISINNQSVSADDNSSQAPHSVDESSKETEEEEHARRLSEARERRERSQRFVYLTSRAADLHRVWAPKQQKPAKGNLETLREKSKLSRKRVADSVVCETPLFGTKRPFAQGSIEEGGRVKTNSRPISKALFQDDI